MSQCLFDDVKQSYKSHVVESVASVLQENMQDAVKLGNLMQQDLRIALARQRRDYGLSEEFQAEFPVEDLPYHVREDAPCHNLEITNACGKVGYRTKKNMSLSATSISIVIAGTKRLREKYGGSFREYAEEAAKIKKMKLDWKLKQDTMAEKKMSAKEIMSMKIEARVLAQLKELKKQGGPFTSEEEVTAYISDESIDEDLKSRRLKMEVQYARDTSISLPKSSSVFRIMKKKQPNAKGNTQLTALEFSENLTKLLTKKKSASGKRVSISNFMSCI